MRTYTTRLLGSESALVLHGGGNTSLKGTYRNVFGQDIPTLFMKASGFNLGTIEPEGHTPMDLDICGGCVPFPRFLTTRWPASS